MKGNKNFEKIILVPESITNNLPTMVKNELLKLPVQKQEEFIEEYKRKAKSISIAYIFWLLLGAHYIYLRRWGTQILFWLTWGGFFIWWLIDVFRIPGMIKNYNKDISIDVLRNLKAISS